MKLIGDFNLEQARTAQAQLDQRIRNEEHREAQVIARKAFGLWLMLEESERDPEIRAAFADAAQATKRLLMALAKENE